MQSQDVINPTEVVETDAILVADEVVEIDALIFYRVADMVAETDALVANKVASTDLVCIAEATATTDTRL